MKQPRDLTVIRREKIRQAKQVQASAMQGGIRFKARTQVAVAKLGEATSDAADKM